MSRIATLHGFCRPLPNVLTFVLPVFLDDANVPVAQDVDEDGQVRGLIAIDLSRGFEPISLVDIAVSIGRPALQGFELDRDRVVIGHATALADYLRSVEWERTCDEEDLQDGRPEIVNDFIDLVAEIGEALDSVRCLMLFARAPDTTYRIKEVDLSTAATSAGESTTMPTAHAVAVYPLTAPTSPKAVEIRLTWSSGWETTPEEFDQRIAEVV